MRLPLFWRNQDTNLWDGPFVAGGHFRYPMSGKGGSITSEVGT